MFFNKKFTVTFASEAMPQLFLACSQFLGKFEPRCSYKFVLIKKARTSAWVGSPKGPYKRTQQDTVLLTQQCWELWNLLVLVVWCMQTNTTTVNIVGGCLKRQCILVQLRVWF